MLRNERPNAYTRRKEVIEVLVYACITKGRGGGWGARGVTTGELKRTIFNSKWKWLAMRDSKRPAKLEDSACHGNDGRIVAFKD